MVRLLEIRNFFFEGRQIVLNALIACSGLLLGLVLHIRDDVLADLDICPLQLQSLCIDFEEQRLNFIGIVRGVKIALELLSGLLEIECIADKHLFKLAFKSRSPSHSSKVFDHSTFSVRL